MESIGKMNASPASKLVYLYLKDKGDGLYTQKQIADDLGIANRTIRNSLEQLRWIGAVETKQEFKPNKYGNLPFGKLFYKTNKNEVFCLTKDTFIDNLVLGNVTKEIR